MKPKIIEITPMDNDSMDNNDDMPMDDMKGFDDGAPMNDFDEDDEDDF
ncbi:MAG: hypothetical protein U0X76_07210 [Bacteroidia bacterium]